MRMLVIDEAAKAKARAVCEYAERPENWYDITGSDRQLLIPGNNPQHVIRLDTFRCVFSITKSPDGLYRHLSISVPSSGFPNPYAAFTIAEMFGFAGWDGKTAKPGPDWLISANHAEHCVVVACPYLLPRGAAARRL